MLDPVILKRFETPDEVREMPFGRFEIIRLAGITVGRATYQPGWKWSCRTRPCSVVGRVAVTPHQAAGHDSFLGLQAPRCPAAELGRLLTE